MDCETTYQEEILEVLIEEPECSADDIAIELEITVEEAEKGLNLLRSKGKAVEVFKPCYGYLWSAS